MKKLTDLLTFRKRDREDVEDVVNRVMKENPELSDDFYIRFVTGKFIRDHADDGIYDTEPGDTRAWISKDSLYKDGELEGRNCVIMYRQDHSDMFMPVIIPGEYFSFATGNDTTLSYTDERPYEIAAPGLGAPKLTDRFIKACLELTAGYIKKAINKRN